MLIDVNRIEKYLNKITTELDIINSILLQSNNEILQSSHLIRSLKYSIIVIAEAIANVLHHILAKKHNVAISGYKEIFVKAKEYQIVSSELLGKLQPFFNFRNILVHHYWKVDNNLFIKNLRGGVRDFQNFMKEINSLMVNYSKELKDNESKNS